MPERSTFRACRKGRGAFFSARAAGRGTPGEEGAGPLAGGRPRYRHGPVAPARPGPLRQQPSRLARGGQPAPRGRPAGGWLPAPVPAVRERCGKSFRFQRVAPSHAATGGGQGDARPKHCRITVSFFTRKLSVRTCRHIFPFAMMPAIVRFL